MPKKTLTMCAGLHCCHKATHSTRLWYGLAMACATEISPVYYLAKRFPDVCYVCRSETTQAIPADERYQAVNPTCEHTAAAGMPTHFMSKQSRELYNRSTAQEAPMMRMCRRWVVLTPFYTSLASFLCASFSLAYPLCPACYLDRE